MNSLPHSASEPGLNYVKVDEGEIEEELEPLPTVMELYPSLFEPVDIKLEPFVSKC